MKPFEVEIFDRQFNFRCNALIDDSDFVYKYDALSPEKNTIKISKDIPVRVTSEEGTTGDGSICTSDYVRISDGENEYTGVITKIEKDDNYTIITYMDILHLFDHEVYLKVDDVKLTYIEDYLYTILGNEFIATDDNSQKIYGLSITKTSQTEGIFDYCYTENTYAIVNLLNDYIAPMFRDFLISMTAKINISNKSVDVVIGKVDETDITNVEGDIPNVFDSNYVIRQSNNNQNKLELIDTYNNQYDRYKFYLHASDYSFNQTNSDRITPVVNELEEFDSSIITEEAYWEEANATLVTIQRLLQYNGVLSDGELNLLQESFRVIYPYYKYYLDSQISGSEYHRSRIAEELGSYVYLDQPFAPMFPTRFYEAYDYLNCDPNDNDALTSLNSHGCYANFAFLFDRYTTSLNWDSNLDFRNKYDGGDPWDLDEWNGNVYQATGTDGSSHTLHVSVNGIPDECRVVLTDGGDGFFGSFFWWFVGGRKARHDCYWQGNSTFSKGSPYLNQDRSHLHVKLPFNITIRASYLNTGPGQREDYDIIICSGIKGYINIPVTYSDLTAAINAYKQSPEYQADYARYRAEKFNYILTAYANKTFKASKYSNNIEIVVKQDDSMIKPMEMKIGQVANIIHDGVSYNSILTGKEIKGGLVKLIFGTIRLELTKILNMKGI